MPEAHRIVLESLAQLGSAHEARHFLEEYSEAERSRFAVIKAGGGILRDQLDELTSSLAFLYHLGLQPVVLHGAGLQVDEALRAAGLEIEKNDGLRKSTEPVMDVVRQVVIAENARLIETLAQKGIEACAIREGVFQCSYLDRERLGLVGRISQVNLAPIQAAVDSGALPVLGCLGESTSGRPLNVNADIATRELVLALRPRKIIFLTPAGGLLDPNGWVISAISIDHEYESLMEAPWVHSGMRLKLQQIHKMLNGLEKDASVSITSAERLGRELFTYRGAGTLVRRGEEVSVYRKPDSKILERVASRVERSFGKKLRKDWATGLPAPLVLVSESARACAVVLEGQDGIPYLDKFVVTPEAQGEGLGATLWRELRSRFAKMYWRSRASNPVTTWYFHHADSSIRQDGWVIFTVGIEDATQREHVVRDALARDSGWTGEAS